MPGYRDPDYAATEIAFDVLQSPRSDFSRLGLFRQSVATGAEYDPQPQAGLGFTYMAIRPGGDTAAALRRSTTSSRRIKCTAFRPNSSRRRRSARSRKMLLLAQFHRGARQRLVEAVAIQGLNSPDDMIALFNKVTPDDVDRGSAVTSCAAPPSPASSRPSRAAAFLEFLDRRARIRSRPRRRSRSRSRRGLATPDRARARVRRARRSIRRCRTAFA